MINKNNKFAIILSIFFGALVTYKLITTAISEQWDVFGIAFLVIILFFMPFIITHYANKKQFKLPRSFELLSVIFIILGPYLGELQKLYSTVSWWDLFIHGIYGVISVVLSFEIIKTIFKNQDDVSHNRYIFFSLILAFSFSIGFGSLWEIFEYFGDTIFGTEMIKGGLDDTAIDLIVNALAALVTSIIFYFYNKKSSISE